MLVRVRGRWGGHASHFVQFEGVGAKRMSIGSDGPVTRSGDGPGQSLTYALTSLVARFVNALES